MKGKFYGLVAVIIGLFFLIPAVRDLRRGYSVERNKRSGNTRISKPPGIGYYFGVGVMLSVGAVFTTLGLASILIPSTGTEERKKRKQGQPGLLDTVSGNLVCPQCGGVLRTKKARQCPHCHRSLDHEKDTS